MVARNLLEHECAQIGRDPLAVVEQLPGAVDAEPLDRVARPAPTVGLALQAILGGEQAVAPVGGDMALEIGLAAEQAEAVLDLPLDVRPDAARLGERGGGRHEQECGQAENKKSSHDDQTVQCPIDMDSTLLAAEIWGCGYGEALMTASS